MFAIVAIIILAIIFLSSALRVLREYERAVVFRLGRIIGAKGPGLIILIPFIDRMVRVSLRVVAMDVPAQDIITRDNVSVKVNAVVYFRVVDPIKSVIEVEDYFYATSQLAQTTLRSVCGAAELDDLLAEREKINNELQEILDKHTDPWGVKVSTVEVKHIDLPQEMQRAMAKQAEAERERRAKVINAEGEFQAADKLAQEGLEVILVDLKPELVERGLANIRRLLAEAVERKIMSQEKADQTLSRIKGSTDLKAVAEADLIIEAVFEDKQVKTSLFTQLSQIAKPGSVLATNTSSFKVSELALAYNRPEEFIGLHFFYHPAKNRLLEIIPGQKTSSQALRLAKQYARMAGKTEIEVADAPGFAVNRFFVPWLNEATRLLEEGLANLPTIDQAAKEAFRIGLGPFELMNATGVPIAYHSAQTLGQELGDFYKPSRLLSEQAAKGPWDLAGEVIPEKKPAVADRLLGVVFLAAAELVEEGVASLTDTDIGAKVGLRWRLGPFELMNQIGMAKAFDLVQAIISRHPDRKMPKLISEHKSKARPFDLRYVSLKIEDSIGWITFNRPEAMNALNPTVMPQLDEAIETALADPEVKTIVLEGKGKAFVAGADVGFFVKSIKAGRFKDIYDFTAYGHEVLKKLEQSGKLTIAKLDGLALGGGAEIALACQTIVATERGSIGFPETGIGIYPGLGGTQRLPRRIGPALAKYLILTGQTVAGRELVETGLAEYYFPSAEVEEKIRQLAASGQVLTKNSRPAPILSGRWVEAAGLFQDPEALDKLLKGTASGETAQKVSKTLGHKAPLALKFAYRLIDEGLNLDLDSALATELANLETIFGTEDALLGLSNVGKRVEFKGR